MPAGPIFSLLFGAGAYGHLGGLTNDEGEIKEMKKTLLAVISLCLIAAGIFGMIAGFTGLENADNITEYKTSDHERGLEGVDTLDCRYRAAQGERTDLSRRRRHLRSGSRLLCRGRAAAGRGCPAAGRRRSAAGTGLCRLRSRRTASWPKARR